MRVFAPGRVNLIGDHVDYMGGLVLPMAIQLGTAIELDRAGDTVRLRSKSEADEAVVDLPVDELPPAPLWVRFVASVLRELGTEQGFSGHIESTLPIGAGLSSSTSLSIAVALAAGYEGSLLELARTVLAAEVAATGVPGGLMDHLVITQAVPGSALLIDCFDDTIRPVALPEGTAVHAVHSGVQRRLADSAYARRRAECERAEESIGPLRLARPGDEQAIADETVRRRARHVITEIARVGGAAEAAASNDAAGFGRLMTESHRSLRDDFAVSIPELDHLLERLLATPGVHGARLTGAGFGGCVVALTETDADLDEFGGWRLEAGGPARVVER
jgi:galactokinase